MFIDYGYIYHLWLIVIDYGLWVKFMATLMFLVMVYSSWFMVMAMVYGYGSQFVACGLWL